MQVAEGGGNKTNNQPEQIKNEGTAAATQRVEFLFALMSIDVTEM